MSSGFFRIIQCLRRIWVVAIVHVARILIFKHKILVRKLEVMVSLRS